jgi:hypothetical protein
MVDVPNDILMKVDEIHRLKAMAVQNLSNDAVARTIGDMIERESTELGKMVATWLQR